MKRPLRFDDLPHWRRAAADLGYRSCMSGMDKAKNKIEELGGEGKETVGKATDDRDLETEGQADQASGNLKQAGEKVKDVFK